jgi:RimJ/RimL family protein N-acetyltransferase
VMGLEEIWTGTRAENSAWRGMMEKLGMTFREAEYSGDGEEVLYAVLREEFLDVPPTSGNPAPSAS